MKQQVTLKSYAPLDLKPSDLEELRISLLSDPTVAEVVDVNCASAPPVGGGAGLADILNLVVPNEQFFRDFIWTSVLYTVGEFMKKRMRNRGNRRSRIEVSAATEPHRVIAVYAVDDDHDAPVEITSNLDPVESGDVQESHADHDRQVE